MNYATISADVISYSLLPDSKKRKLEAGIRSLISEFEILFKRQHFFGRLVQGDYFECAIKDPKYALRIALLLKTFVKSFNMELNKEEKAGLKYFIEHGVRLAVAVAPLSILDPKNEIIDGEAIYLSGRTIKTLSTSDKQKIVIKNTMYFSSPDPELEEQFDMIFSLLDTIISRCSAKQSEVVYYKLLSHSEKDIARMLKKNQSTISQHSTAAGWISIEKAIHFFEKNIQ